MKLPCWSAGLLLAGLATTARAQEPVAVPVTPAPVLVAPSDSAVAARSTSPVIDLLTAARQAFDGLKYHEADSIAQEVLSLTRLSQRQRLTALQVSSAALYPEDDDRHQYPDSALAQLRRMVRLSYDASLSREVSWQGLDSLFQIARRTTFVLKLQYDSLNTMTGPAGRVQLTAISTRPAWFYLVIPAGANSGQVVLDSAGPVTEANLAFSVMAGDQPRFASGRFPLQILSTDTETEESIILKLAMTIDAPPISLVPVPGAFDQNQLRPERTRPAKVTGTIVGLLLGGATGAVVSALRGPDPLKDVKSDSRGYVVGGGMALGAIAGAFLDRGRPLKENIAFNAQARARFEQERRTALAQNESIVQGYRSTLTITPAEN